MIFINVFLIEYAFYFKSWVMSYVKVSSLVKIIDIVFLFHFVFVFIVNEFLTMRKLI